MNPIEFLQANGINPEVYRTPVVQTVASAKAENYRCTRPFLTKGCRIELCGKKRPRTNVPQNLVNKILKLAKISTHSDIIAPLIPYLLVDMVNVTNDDFLKSASFIQEEKMYYNALINSCRRYTKEMFRSLSQEEIDLAVDFMSEFECEVANDLEIFRLAVQKPIMELPTEMCTTLSALCVCLLLAASAMNGHNSLYGPTGRKGPGEDLLKGVCNNARMLFHHYGMRAEKLISHTVNLCAEQSVLDAEECFNRRVVKFIDSYAKKEDGESVSTRA